MQLATHRLLHWLVAFWIFCGGFVLIEPSPYELAFLMVLPVAIFARVGIHKGTANLFYMIALFVPFSFLAAFQVRYGTILEALIFTSVTIFLQITGYFAANYVADAPYERMRHIMRAYIGTAILVALVGIFAYLGLLPGRDLFLLYGRAKSTFNDPNVYGPFLILPAMYLLQRLLLGKARKLPWNAVGFGILFIGVFVSFSRGAWGHLMLSSIIVFALCFALEANARHKVRMLILALIGAACLVVAIGGLLSIPSVRSLFIERFSLTQSYDTGTSGRFGRQGYAFDMALEHPLGLGPNQFGNYRVTEAPHNTYVTVLHVYGWGGGLIYWCMIGTTFWRGLKGSVHPSPNRLIMIPLFATYTALILESAIIDTDHWRHFFLLTGLIWGVSARMNTLTDAQKEHRLTSLV